MVETEVEQIILNRNSSRLILMLFVDAFVQTVISLAKSERSKAVLYMASDIAACFFSFLCQSALVIRLACMSIRIFTIAIGKYFLPL